MSVSGRVVVGEFAYGNPASFGEPLGLWAGQAQLVGDGTGGVVTLVFITQNPVDTPPLDDRRRQYVYFIDNASIRGVGGVTGDMSCQVSMHMARSNAALTPPFFTTKAAAAIADGIDRLPATPLVDPQTTRMPIFWDTEEFSNNENNLAIMRCETNTAGVFYDFRAYGRYYDRQVLSNRAFGRLISPPPVAPGD